MALLPSTPFDARKFSFDCAKRTAAVEISDLGLRNFKPLYDDAADVGIVLLNPETGNESHWYLCEGETQTDPEGDVIAWKLRPCTESVRRHPRLRGFVMSIYND